MQDDADFNKNQFLNVTQLYNSSFIKERFALKITRRTIEST